MKAVINITLGGRLLSLVLNQVFILNPMEAEIQNNSLQSIINASRTGSRKNTIDFSTDSK
jgi:hypothetical protein